MGDSKEEYDADPYIAIIDEEGHEYNDEEIISQYDIELISYTKPQPIKNTFVFSKISLLHEGSMLVMTGVGILVIVASIIFVKKEKKLNTKHLIKFRFL